MNTNADEFGPCIYLILKRGGELVEAVKQGQLSVKKVSQSNSTPVSFLPNILSTFFAQKISHARTNLAQCNKLMIHIYVYNFFKAKFSSKRT